MTGRNTPLYHGFHPIKRRRDESGKESSTQRAYLLRCWWEGGDSPGEAPRWRFSVEEVLSKQPRRGFDDLEAVFGFLRAEMAGGEDERAR
jgi:hypothetical protein